MADAENVHLSLELLETRDALIGAEAELREAQQRTQDLEDEILRTHELVTRLEALDRSMIGRSYHKLRQLRHRLPPSVQAVLRKLQ